MQGEMRRRRVLVEGRNNRTTVRSYSKLNATTAKGRLRDLRKEAKRLDGKIRAKKGESETMQNRTPPSKFLAGTMEWLKNEVRHWSRIVDLLKQEVEKIFFFFFFFF